MLECFGPQKKSVYLTEERKWKYIIETFTKPNPKRKVYKLKK